MKGHLVGLGALKAGYFPGAKIQRVVSAAGLVRSLTWLRPTRPSTLWPSSGERFESLFVVIRFSDSNIQDTSFKSCLQFLEQELLFLFSGQISSCLDANLTVLDQSDVEILS